MRVVVLLSVFQAWREGYFRLLQERHPVELVVVHGPGVAGTKLRNAGPTPAVKRVELMQRQVPVRLSGRQSHAYYFRGLLRTISETLPDVLLLEGGSNLANNFLVMLWAKSKNIPVVWWTLGELPGRRYSHLGKLVRNFTAFLERRADALLLYSSVAQEYALRVGVLPERCFIATNVVDTEAVHRRALTARARAGLKRSELFPPEAKVVVFVGALTEGKRLDRLPGIIALIRQQEPSAYFLIVGDGNLRVGLEEQISRFGLTSVVKFAGEQREAVSEYMLCGDVFLLPGLGGLAISDAMAHGLPVVCAQGDGTEIDLVLDGVTGFRCRGSDEFAEVEALSEGVVRVLKDVDLRMKMSHAAIRHVTESYSGSHMVDQMFSALQYAVLSNRERLT